MLPKDYIAYKLTGIHSTDVSDASGMLLLDVKNRCWSEEMLGICGIREAVMPGLYESSDVIGTLTKAASEETGLPQSVKVIAGAGDNAAAAIGTGTVARANAIFRLVHQEQCSFHRINFRWTTITRFIPLRMPTVNIISWAVCLVRIVQ